MRRQRTNPPRAARCTGGGLCSRAMKKPTAALLPVWRSALGAMAVGAALAACGAPTSSDSASDAAPEIDRAALQSASLADVLDEPAPFERVRRLATLLEHAGPELLPDVRPALNQARIRLGAAEFDLIIRYWATHDPRGVVRWLLREAPLLHRVAAIRTAVEIWASRDPAATLAAVSGAAKSADRDVAQAVQFALIYGWLDADPEEVAEYIRGLGEGVIQQRSLMAYALGLARKDGVDAVMAWAESLPDSEERYKRHAFRQVTSALAWFDAEAAERWCEAHCDGPYGAEMRNIIINNRLADGEDGADVIAWAATAPEGRARDEAVASAFSRWALREQREKALDWMAAKLAEPEPEPWLPALYGSYARYLAAESPAKAIQWAERVQHEAAREQLLVRIARKWLGEDEEAAEAWLRESSLSPNARESARKRHLPTYLPEVRGDGGPAEPAG